MSSEKSEIQTAAEKLNVDTSSLTGVLGSGENNEKVKCEMSTKPSTKSALSDSIPPLISTSSTISNTNSSNTRVMPLVFVQASSKLNVPTTSVSSVNTTTTSQILVNTNSQFVSSLGTKLNISNKPTNTSLPSVVFSQTGTTKPQQIIIQKSSSNTNTQTLIPVSVETPTGTKQTFAYIGAIIKPSGTGKIQNDNPIVVGASHLPAGLVPAPTNQKLVLTPMSMPKLTRHPVTCSTTSINQPKLANLILPMALSSQIKNNSQSVINFKISNGQIQSDPKGSITVLCDNKKTSDNNNDVSQSIKNDIVRDSEVIDKEKLTPELVMKNNNATNLTSKYVCDKTYELSISEDPVTKCDLSYTIKFTDDMKTYKIERNGKEIDQIKADIENPLPINNYGQTKQEVPHRKPLHEVPILKKCNLNASEKKSCGLLRHRSFRESLDSKLSSETSEQKSDSTDSKVAPAEVRKVNTERRRKSQYTYLRDYDEVVVTSGNAWEDNKISNTHINKYKQFQNAEITLTKLSSSPEDDLGTVESEVKKSVDDFVEIEVVKQQEIPQISTEDDKDIRTVLEWKDGIGSLPGSKLKFHINEFGFIEMLVGDEYNKMVMLKNELNECKKEEDNTITGNEILNCSECGCYGMPSEFVSRNYCSVSCKANALHAYEKMKRDAFLKDSKSKRKKRKLAILAKQETSIEPQIKTEEGQPVLKESSIPSDEDNTSNDASQDSKVNYPWQGGKKGFSWAKYLDHVKAKAAPLKLFKDPFPYAKNGFRPGMKLEGIDPQHPSYYCVLSVAEVQGYRLRLHFDGYPDSYDFWLNADSMDIFPCGWCEKYSHILHPPPSYSQSEFNWTTYLKNCRATSAPRHLFSNRAGNSICPNGFRLGMKMEAVDKKNSSLVCVATVTDLMDNRFLVHFDSWDDIYDYWADPTSPYIHPVGWCDQFGHNLTPPNDYPHPEKFTWEKFLKETKSTAAPVRAFKQRPTTGFRRGMRIECVDKRVPSLIRVATVDDVREHQIRVHFDGWPDKYCYWVDDDSADIHPAGWCQKTGHPLESPLTPEDVYENFEDCPTVGCRGVGHVLGAKYAAHNSAKDCPYSDENLSDPPLLPDRLRLIDPDIKQEAVIPVSRVPRKDMKHIRLCKAPKIRRLTETEIKQEWPIEEDPSDFTKKRKLYNRELEQSPELNENKNKISEEINSRFKSLVSSNDYAANPSQQALVKHSKYLNEIIGYNNRDPRLWSDEEVAEFVGSLPSCKEHSKLFTVQKIDGEAFLMLTQKDLVDILKFKLGPAIKLYNSILLLRQNVNIYN